MKSLLQFHLSVGSEQFVLVDGRSRLRIEMIWAAVDVQPAAGIRGCYSQAEDVFVVGTDLEFEAGLVFGGVQIFKRIFGGRVVAPVLRNERIDLFANRWCLC